MTRSGKAIITAAALVVLVGVCGSSSTESLNLGNGSNGTSSGSNSGGGNDSLSALIGKGKTADVKVTYKTNGSDAVTIVQRGNDSVFKSGDTAVYSVGGKTTTCNGTGSSATCTQISGANGLGGSLGTGLLTSYNAILRGLAASPLVKDVKQSSATIAGRNAKCFTLTGALAAAAAGKSGTLCIDADTGILFRVAETGSGSNYALEATSVGSPSDSDFKIPATPKTLTIPSYTSTP